MTKLRRLRIPGVKIKMPRISPRFWIIASGAAVVVLIALLLFVLLRSAYVEIPYSTFVAQVRAGNVERIDIRGGEITGVLREPIFLPPDEPGTSAGYTQFSTAIPAAMSDTWLYPLLDQKDTTVTISPPVTAWYLYVLLWGVPLLALLAIVWVIRRSDGVPHVAPQPEITEPAPEPEPAVTAVPDTVPAQSEIGGPAQDTALVPAEFSGILPREKLADVVGQDQAKMELRDLLAFAKNEEERSNLLHRYPKGAVLVGVHGTGKTLLARAIAGETHRSLFQIDLADVVETHSPGDRLPLRDVFAAARAAAPSIVFLDELDVLSGCSSTGSRNTQDGTAQLLGAIVSEMDRIETAQRVFVVAAATNSRRISPALLRPGRFGRPIFLHLPERQERLELLRRLLHGVSVAETLDLETIARRSAGLSGVDLRLLADRAIWMAKREGRSEVTQEDFGNALAYLVLSNNLPGQFLSNEDLRIAAYHQAGHALISQLLAGRLMPQRLSVLPDAEFTRCNVFHPAGHGFQTKSALLARLTVILGGRTAEELAIGDVTTSAEDDLESATLLARHMVARWGMSDLGPVSFPFRDQSGDLAVVRGDSDRLDCSESSASQIDRAVRVLLEDRHAVARHILKRNSSVLDHLANLLVREETIQGDALTRLMDKVSSAASLDEPRSR